MDNIELKQEYNQLLIRFKKAQNYFDNLEIDTHEKEKYLNELTKLIDKMDKVLWKIGNYTDREVLKGFREE